jgi:Tfp pilus assembly protein PilV
MKFLTTQRGQSLTEVIVALTVMSLGFLAVSSLVGYAHASTDASARRMTAEFLALEGIEAARVIRDGSYAALTPGTHGVSIAPDHVSLIGAIDTEDQFTRTLQVDEIDAYTKLVTCTVTWTTFGYVNREVVLATVLTDR